MELADLANPYEFSKPVTQRDRFAGRRQELEDIRYYLRHARRVEQPMNLALIGERASGKTSLLNIMDIESKAIDLIPVRINLNSDDAQPISFFWKLYEAIVDSLSMSGLLFEPGSDLDRTYRRIMDSLDPDADHTKFPLRFPAHLAAAIKGGRQISETKLQRDLISLRQATAKTCVLLFDECNILTQNRVTLEMLRNVFMSTPGYMLVLTGTPTLFPLLDDVFSPIIRQFKKVKVQAFKNSEETEACILNPLKSLSIEPREMLSAPWRIRSDVHALSGGRPYEIQLLCHFMFRRVQEERAQRMALTADVIDDVLRELESTISQDATNRPVIEGVRKLTTRQLSALGVLARCQLATVDELLFLNEVKSRSQRFSADELRNHLEELTALGLLTVDEQERVSFVGDEFDRIYVRYHAQSRKVTLAVGTGPYSLHLKNDLYAAFKSIAPPANLLFEESKSLSQAAQALISGSGQLPEIAESLYGPIYEALSSGRLTLIMVELSYRDHVVRSWVSLNGDTYIDMSLNSDFMVFMNRVEEAGGTLQFEEHTVDLPDEETFVAGALSTENRKLLEAFGTYHSIEAGESYQAGEETRVLAHLTNAKRFPLTASGSNNMGYIHLAMGNFDEAEALLSRAVRLAQSEEDYEHAALATYNRAIIRLSKGNTHGAREFFLEAADFLAKAPSKRMHVTCLFEPEATDSVLVLREATEPELSKSISNAAQMLESPMIVQDPVQMRRIYIRNTQG